MTDKDTAHRDMANAIRALPLPWLSGGWPSVLPAEPLPGRAASAESVGSAQGARWSA